MNPRRIRKVALLEPRAPDFHIFSRFGLPRLGVVLLGTILRDQGYQVTVMVEEKQPFDLERVFAADLVGISCLTSTAPRGYEIAEKCRERGIPVVLGGPHPTHRADEALDHADFVVRGEGEAALPALIEALEKGAGFGEVAGLSYDDGERRHHVPRAPLCRDLDQWPDPDFELVAGHRAYSRSLFGTRAIVPLQTSRGCPHDCSFCTVTTTFGRKMRYRSVERVIGEMSRHDLDRTTFFIYDDNFAANRRRAREMLEGFMSLPGRGPRWSTQVRADVAKDEDLLDRMARAGCDTLYIGLESVNEDTLSSTKKRQSVSEVSEHLRRIQARGICVHGMFVFGFDTDGPGTMERTIRFALQQELFSVQFLILTPLPGSRLADELEQSGRLLHREWGLYDAHHVCFQPAQVTPAELQRWQMEGHRRFYSPRQTLRRMVARQWEGAMVNLYASSLQVIWNRKHATYLRSIEQLSRRSSKDRVPEGVPQIALT